MYKLGSSTRLDLEFEKKQKFQMSPAAYNPSHGLTMPAGSKWGFGSDVRKGIGKSSISPGAGTYQIPSKIQEGPKFIMGSKLENEKNLPSRNNPGPGQYDLQNKDNANMHSPKKFSMGSSQRAQMARNSIAPGPGNYGSTFADKMMSPRYGFGSSQRSNLAGKQANVPGPGQYKPKEVMGKEGPLNSMHCKIEYKPIEATGSFTPGPGAYESHTRNK